MDDRTDVQADVITTPNFDKRGIKIVTMANIPLFVRRELYALYGVRHGVICLDY